jgi:hypothetical protein
VHAGFEQAGFVDVAPHALHEALHASKLFRSKVHCLRFRVLLVASFACKVLEDQEEQHLILPQKRGFENITFRTALLQTIGPDNNPIPVNPYLKYGKYGL